MDWSILPAKIDGRWGAGDLLSAVFESEPPAERNVHQSAVLWRIPRRGQVLNSARVDTAALVAHLPSPELFMSVAKEDRCDRAVR